MARKSAGDELMVRDLNYNTARLLVEDAVARGVMNAGIKLIFLVFLLNILFGIFALMYFDR